MAKGPDYYQRGSSDVWDFIRDQGLNFHLGNVVKYVCRAGYKTASKIEDLEKALHYLENELHHEKDVYLRSSQGIPYKVPAKEFDGSADYIISEKSDCLGV